MSVIDDDFQRIKAIINHPDNRSIHYKSLERLIENFQKKHNSLKLNFFIKDKITFFLIENLYGRINKFHELYETTD